MMILALKDLILINNNKKKKKIKKDVSEGDEFGKKVWQSRVEWLLVLIL